MRPASPEIPPDTGENKNKNSDFFMSYFLIRSILYQSFEEGHSDEDKKFRPSFGYYKNDKYFSLLVN